VKEQARSKEGNKGTIAGKKKYPKRDKTQYSNGMRFDVVVVLGMHRSGTSAITKGLELFGIDLGNNLMAPQKDNPKGFFEDKQLVEINDRIFEKAYSHWSSIQFLEPKFLSGPELSEERMAAANWLNMKVAGGNPVGLKDPRLCRMLSFWEPLFTERRLHVGYIFSHRDPTQVGASLQKRNGFGLSYGVDLWAAYAADALLHIQGKSWIAVGFHQLLEEPRRELARIADFLETPWNPASEAVKEYEKEYLDTALWHHRTAKSIPQQENCYQEISNALSILCVKKNNEARKQAHDAAQVVFERVEKISNALSENNRILFHQFAKQEKELEKIRKLLDERTAWAQALDKEVEKTRKLFQEEKKLVEERTIWGKTLDKELALSKETSSMALFQAEEAGKRAKLAEDQQIRLNYIGDCLAEIKKEWPAQKAVTATVAGQLRDSFAEVKQELKNNLKALGEWDSQVAQMKSILGEKEKEIAQATKIDQKIEQIWQQITSGREESKLVVKKVEEERTSSEKQSVSVQKTLNQIRQEMEQDRKESKLVVKKVEEERASSEKQSVSVQKTLNQIRQEMEQGRKESKLVVKKVEEERANSEKQSVSVQKTLNQIRQEMEQGRKESKLVVKKVEEERTSSEKQSVSVQKTLNQIRQEMEKDRKERLKLKVRAKQESEASVCEAAERMAREKEIAAGIHSSIEKLVKQVEQNRLEMSAQIDLVKGSVEGRIVEMAQYASEIQDSIVAVSSHSIFRIFSRFAALSRIRKIKKPSWLQSSPSLLPPRPGFWKRLERSIRKRRKRWIGRIGFDRDWYLKEYPDVPKVGIDPLDHYVSYGILEGRWKSKKDKQKRPNPHKKRVLEDLLLGELGKNIRKQLWLLWSYPRVKAQLKLSFRLLEKNFPFDPIWYQVKYPDVKGTSMSPFMHFIEYGAREGRLPNRRFSQECYLALAPEVASSGIPASLHFLMKGWDEERLINWLDRYVEQSFDREIRERFSGLLDLLLAEEDPEDLSGARERKISQLRDRLSLALRKRESPTDEPKVSIIIPVYNQLAYTLACVTSLYESDPSTTLEVIIADDCSNDGTREIFKEFAPWIKMVRTSRNLGFLRNCNHAAKTAKGEFIAFLNNDMVVLPGWLDSLVSTFVVDPECGMVGSKLLNLDGTLQEAGGIFWNDGSAWNYGRGQNPTSHEFNYKKEVDYCSGASICLRKEVWDAVDGFDEIYAPAYCEESDLAFRLRARGLKTIYQPRSVGVHLEGVSCGTDTAHGIKAYQVTNLEKFQNRWSDVLKKEHFPNAKQVFFARDRSAKKRHMLFVDHHLPRPDFDAGSKQMATYLQVFVEMGFQITFWPDNLNYEKEYAHPLEELGIEVISCNAGLIEFEEWIGKNGPYLDVAFLSRPFVALKYIQSLKKNSKASLVFYGHDIHSLRTKGELKLNTANQSLLERLRVEEQVEVECWEKCDTILYPSNEEKQYILGKFPGLTVDILPLYCKSADEIIAAKTASLFDKRSGILFVGGFDHSPNTDGILWFCNEILPLIRKISRDVCLTIAGSNPPKEIRSLENKFIKVTGRISDHQLSAYYDSHRVSVAPLRFGSGVKGKVVESMLKGLPMVTTKIGSQGLCYADKALAIAHSEYEFSNKVVQLLKNENRWLQQRDSARRFFEKNFSSQEIKVKLKTFLK